MGTFRKATARKHSKSIRQETFEKQPPGNIDEIVGNTGRGNENDARARSAHPWGGRGRSCRQGQDHTVIVANDVPTLCPPGTSMQAEEIVGSFVSVTAVLYLGSQSTVLRRLDGLLLLFQQS